MTPEQRKTFIFDLLANKARVVMARQLLEQFWPPSASGQRHGRRTLGVWMASGLLQSFTAEVIRVHEVRLLHAGTPETPLPDFEELEHELRAAWRGHRPAPTRLLMATRKLIGRCGGTTPARVVNPDALAHDLGLGFLLLTLHRHNPLLLAAYVSEDALPVVHSSVNPDGFIASSEGPLALLEFCGSSYSATRLEAIVRFARTYPGGGIAYQLWTIAPQEAT
jgi:hypothetical protein